MHDLAEVWRKHGTKSTLVTPHPGDISMKHLFTGRMISGLWLRSILAHLLLQLLDLEHQLLQLTGILLAVPLPSQLFHNLVVHSLKAIVFQLLPHRRTN